MLVKLLSNKNKKIKRVTWIILILLGIVFFLVNTGPFSIDVIKNIDTVMKEWNAVK